MIRRLGAAVLLLSFVCVLSLSQAQQEVLTKKDEDRRDLTLLRRLTENSFVHEASRVTYTVPKDWKEIRPQRLERKIETTRTSTMMGIELAQRDVVATLLWLPMQTGDKLTDLIRDTAVAGEYGEEYETLKVVYGKENISLPEKKSYSGRTVYKVSVKGGPDRGEKYDGALFMFESGSPEGRWLIKVRVSYPKSDTPAGNAKYADDVLAGYGDFIPSKKDELPKTPEVPK